MPGFPGRTRVEIEGDFVVFAIGMRINRPRKTAPVAADPAAMPKMLRELGDDPDSGFLGGTQGTLNGGPAMLQYSVPESSCTFRFLLTRP